MPRPRPQLSITLPRNFTFHYTEGEEPKTPEKEVAAPKPPSPHAFRVKRRIRPSILPSYTSKQTAILTASQDVPIPTIETVEAPAPVRPDFQQRATEPAQGYLAPDQPRRFMTAPRTPSAQLNLFDHRWKSMQEQKSVGESISRPMSACSLMSDSSDESNDSSGYSPSLGGSCTSPESDAPDPFVVSSTKKGKTRSRPALLLPESQDKRPHVSKRRQVQWTVDMDNHIWTTYMTYLQDPTVTPFKMLPGTAPPLGVCHRVAREARRTWRGSKMAGRHRFETPLAQTPETCKAQELRGDSPDTIKASRSGSTTPTGTNAVKPPIWPKSGSSTRRRLRELCKRKAVIAPHYQRLLQSRSPSPFTSASRSNSHSSRLSTPVNERDERASFATRGIQISLTTSTAASMQVDGPLAQLSKTTLPQTQDKMDWFNDPSVPFASPAAIPSDSLVSAEYDMNGSSPDPRDEPRRGTAPRLGSPFGYQCHTWGPSRSRKHLRPTPPRTQSDDVPVAGPSLKSPARIHGTFPYSSLLKRRAPNQLQDEVSPGDPDVQQQTLLEDIFGSQRRVRTRGFSLPDVSVDDRMNKLFTPPSSDIAENASSDAPASTVTESVVYLPGAEPDTVRRLGSPFSGISSRPSRARGRHVPSASLSAFDPSEFSSIESRLGDAANIHHTLH
ncbi:hypothetical protein MMC09_004009 [Bachmanniomyces sp. S44760]|nr:hypothetical protein [Bachmanniomyces sp. S44760]